MRRMTPAFFIVLCVWCLQCGQHADHSSSSAPSSLAAPSAMLTDCLSLRGAFVRASDWPTGRMTVACAGASSASLDGVAASGNGPYTVSPRAGLNILHIEGPGLPGKRADMPFLYGDYRTAGGPVPDALTLRVNTAGWSRSDGKIDLPLQSNSPLDVSDIGTQVLRDAGNLLAQYVGASRDAGGTALGVSYDAGVSVGALQYDSSNVAVVVTPWDRGVTVTATIPSPSGEFSWSASALGIDLGDTVDVTAESIQVQANAELDFVPDAGDGHPGIAAQLQDHQMTVTNLQIGSMALDSLGVVGSYVEAGLSSAVQWLFNSFGDAILSSVQSSVLPAITTGLSQFDLPSQVSLPAGRGQLALSQDIDSAAFDASGSQMGISASVGPGAPIALPSPGFLITSSGAPALGTDPPFGLALSLDYVNEALHSAWAQGAFQSVILPAEKLGGVATDSLEVSAKLPAVVTANGDGTGLTFELGDIELSTTLHGVPSLGSVPLTIAASVVAQLDIALAPGGDALQLMPNPQHSEIVIGLVDLPSGLQGAADQLTNIVKSFLSTTLASASTTLAPPSIPLPTLDLARLSPGFAGRTGVFAGMLRFDGQSQHIVLTGDLESNR